jgi:membrane fusion protein (multidrug efflux system)
MVEKETAAPKNVGNRIRRGHVRGLLVAVLGVVMAIGAYWWLYKFHRVTTDDAYVKANSAQISSRVPGTVVGVQVMNDHWVEVGQTLVELDPADYKVAVERNEAIVAESQADVKASELTITQTEGQTAAQVKAAEAALQSARDKEREAGHKLDELQSKRLAVTADLGQAEKDFERFESIFRQGAGTERLRDQANTGLKKAKAQSGAIGSEVAAVKASLASIGQEVDRARAQLQSAQSERHQVQIQRHKLESLKARLRKAEADLEASRLNLSYTVVAAPIEGYIAQKNVQVGERIQPGQALMAVVPLREVYVEANFKETELTNVRLGQPATIHADVYPGYSYHGKVAGIRAGTGAVFSLLPPENATGNWIKVVQRVPVKIYLDAPPPPDHPLGLGYSLEVTIDTSDRSGKILASEASPPPGGLSSAKP